MSEKLVASPFSTGRRFDRLQLLGQIDTLGSMQAAAKAMGISYKSAWEAVESLNNLSETPLVERSIGGASGGGTRLTDRGRQVLTFMRDMDRDFQAFIAAMEGSGRAFDRFFQAYQRIRRFEMRTSARNQYLGRVVQVTRGTVNAEVVLDIGGGDTLVAIITNTSVENLALEPGVEAHALVKAPWVIVTTDENFRSSARNRLCGVVTRCVEGAVNGEVILDLPGGKSVAAIITNDSIRQLGLQVGSRACALIKASHIILAVTP
ncbi:Molybdenum-pterin-binding protein MopA [Candidatus Magnetaquicoccaceae bacterium FCR-1]|uniref:Molybdenum-pterin-binding protein MopA n=1 Tax=Candidatus Magnetaquiglobus chichijimensis TaxID=3141448 RepID=A0ABQ0C8C8_9PROT